MFQTCTLPPYRSFCSNCPLNWIRILFPKRVSINVKLLYGSYAKRVRNFWRYWKESLGRNNSTLNTLEQFNFWFNVPVWQPGSGFIWLPFLERNVCLSCVNWSWFVPKNWRRVFSLSLSLFYSLADVRQFLFLHEPQSKNDVDGNVASITEPNSLEVVAALAAATPENFCQPILNQHET